MPLEGVHGDIIREESRQARPKQQEAAEEELKYDKSDRLVFLDPHYVNPQIDMSKNLESQAHLYHCP